MATYTDFLEQEATLPETLWHYTTQQGLLGILESQSLWATKIHYLNDSSEFSHALKLAVEILDQRIQDGATEQLHKLKSFRESIPRIDSVHVCVASFSEDPDVLSQWRAYGGASGGYAIGFVPERLRELGRDQQLFLIKCKYAETEQSATINHLIDRCLSEPDADPDLALKCWYFPARLARLAPVLKNSTFAEEREWRLVSRPRAVTEMCFREGRSMVVPYVRFELREPADSYLKAVTVGPCPNVDLSIKSAAMLLRKRRIQSAEAKVVGSKIPFRNW